MFNLLSCRSKLSFYQLASGHELAPHVLVVSMLEPVAVRMLLCICERIPQIFLSQVAVKHGVRIPLVLGEEARDFRRILYLERLLLTIESHFLSCGFTLEEFLQL